MSSGLQYLLPRLDILVFFSGLKRTIFGMIKTPEMPFFFKVGGVRRSVGSLLTSLGCIFAPETADHGSFLSHFPLGPRPWGKGRKCMFGNWYHWNSCFNVCDHQHPSSPQGEVEGIVGLAHSMAVPLEESDYHGIAGQAGRHFSSF